jgi:hypothetical protein
MKVWILVTIALVLLAIALWSERFEPTASIQAPPYSAAEKVRIYGMASAADQAILRAKLAAPTEPDAPEKAGALLTPVIGDFFTQVFRPATTPMTPETINTFLTSRPSSDIRDIERRVLRIYFVDQQGIGTAAKTGYADVLAGMGQGVGYLVNQGPTGPAPPAPVPSRATGAASTPSGGGASTPSGGGASTPSDGGAEPTGAAGGATVQGPTGATTTTGAETTTGGAANGYGTTTTPAPSNGLFGPAFTAFGDPSPNGGTPDSSKFTSYPQVLGGIGEKTTTVQGVGVTQRGMYGWDDLPSMESLGAAERSQYLPFSRTPGDMDRIPDPFRVAQTFDLSSLSSKTEPVPFLTDFSAFQR